MFSSKIPSFLRRRPEGSTLGVRESRVHSPSLCRIDSGLRGNDEMGAE